MWKFGAFGVIFANDVNVGNGELETELSNSLRAGLMRTKSGQKGFTLVEVIIVVAIIGILAAVATPMIISSLPRYRLRAEVRELMINFKKAKVEAVKRNRDVVILFVDAVAGVQDGSYQIFVNVDRDANIPHTFDPAAPNNDILLVSQQVRTNVQLVSNFTNEQAGYNPRGLPIQAANQNVALTTSDGTRTLTLSVSQVGNVRLE
ncbi:MAG: GspH/FimT family protein [Chlorobium sp.]|nr:GspH/FimT family protein [Chlorobium sp.]